MKNETKLTDIFGRQHDYLRISLTDRCNLRCRYCMPEHPQWMPRKNLLTIPEIGQIAKTFITQFGINKMRFTGGEPLLRNEFHDLIKTLSAYPVEMGITTNGLLLNESLLDNFIDHHLNALNISLDTLNPLKFHYLTRVDAFQKVWNNIHLALQKDFHLKLNVVVMKGINEAELVDFAALTREQNLHVRFIEFMPFSGNAWSKDKVLSYRQIIRGIEKKHTLEKLDDSTFSTAKSYRIPGFRGTIGVISSVSEPFCSNCNRIRLTADGNLRNCLFTRDEINLRDALRRGEAIEPLIQKAIRLKHWEHGGLPTFNESDFSDQLSARSMASIGG